MKWIVFYQIYLFTFFQLSKALLAPHEITFLIISQQDEYNLASANALKNNILSQISQTEKPPNIYLTHELFNNIPGSWDITTQLLNENLMKILLSPPNIKWIIFCNDQCIINMKLLIENLQKENELQEIFLGYPLSDKEATIIHHFGFFENPSSFLYPLIKAGVAITLPLIKKLSAACLLKERNLNDFFIDSSYEFSLFAWNNGKGNTLKMASYFCVEQKLNCAIYPKTNSTCSQSIDVNRIFFAIKTCKKFHSKRIPIIQQTWGDLTKHIRFYSDHKDETIPTISTNVKNTETGHCEKTLSIFKLILNEIQSNEWLRKQIEWIVLTDDDTLLSITGLCNYLGCYNSKDHIYMGERYGYRLHSSDGFNYITGGGGIVFSMSVIQLIVSECTCPAITSPDDMIIGLCLQNLKIQSIHSSKFHQARPNDYPIEIIEKSTSISFHKFWQINPIEVYRTWFGKENQHNKEQSNQNRPSLSELKTETDHNNNNICASDKKCDNKQNNVIKISNSIKHIDL